MTTMLFHTDNDLDISTNICIRNGLIELPTTLHSFPYLPTIITINMKLNTWPEHQFHSLYEYAHLSIIHGETPIIEEFTLGTFACAINQLYLFDAITGRKSELNLMAVELFNFLTLYALVDHTIDLQENKRVMKFVAFEEKSFRQDYLMDIQKDRFYEPTYIKYEEDFGIDIDDFEEYSLRCVVLPVIEEILECLPIISEDMYNRILLRVEKLKKWIISQLFIVLVVYVVTIISIELHPYTKWISTPYVILRYATSPRFKTVVISDRCVELSTIRCREGTFLKTSYQEQQMS